MGTGPIIGIAGASYVARRPWGELPVVGISRRYAERVAAAGGRPVVLPPLGGSDVLDVLDGLVLAGGGDLAPELYGGPDDAGRDVDPTRDAAELALVRASRAAGVPLLGVCRGLQVMAVADGGSLEPDLGGHHVIPAGTHPVSSVRGSACARLLGSRTEVSALHHQSVRSTGAGWTVASRTDDGVVEAMEWHDPRWPALGVQWHPELDDTGPALFGWLVSQAAGRRDVIRIGA